MNNAVWIQERIATAPHYSDSGENNTILSQVHRNDKFIGRGANCQVMG